MLHTQIILPVIFRDYNRVGELYNCAFTAPRNNFQIAVNGVGAFLHVAQPVSQLAMVWFKAFAIVQQPDRVMAIFAAKLARYMLALAAGVL